MSQTKDRPWKFYPGRLFLTDGVKEQLSRDELLVALWPHVSGDWGIVPKATWIENDDSLNDGEWLVSLYQDDDGTHFFHRHTARSADHHDAAARRVLGGRRWIPWAGPASAGPCQGQRSLRTAKTTSVT